MGTLYPGATIVGYNANPPSDDGLRAASNEVLYQKHKTKLADPVKVLAELIDTDFTVHTDETVLDIATNTTTVAAQHKRTLNVTAGVIISLGSAASLPLGYKVRVRNSFTVAITVDLANGTDTLNGVAAGSITIEPDKSRWFIINPGMDGFFSLENDKFGALLTETTVTKTLDENVSSSTVIQTDDELFFSADANSYYRVGMGVYVEDVVSGIRFRFFGPAGFDYYFAGYQSENVQPSQSLGVNGNIVIDDANGADHGLGNFVPGPGFFVFNGLVTTAGTSGTVTFSWAQNTTGAGATTVKAGSWLNFVKVR